MYNENQPLKSFLYVYNQFEIFLTSISKSDSRINSPMIIFMIHAYNQFMQMDRPLKKKEFLNEKFMSMASFYRLFKQAVDQKLIVEAQANHYSLEHDLPHHLRLLKAEILI